MPTIQVLDSHVADLIAAGEVVERPASVAKELMENAIDAGASKVTVEISHGGLTFLRVTDDGKGIPAGELKTAFLRHATSKLRTAYDLEAIGTLGFRGEALAAISAVSRVEVMTRTADAPLGASLSLEGGVPGEIEEAGCPLGTTMVVRDLFYNTPARLKFMKKDSAEGAAVFAVVQRVALSHPEVSVKFIRDGKQELLTPGDGALQSAVYAVLGRELALGFREVKCGGEGVKVTGFISQPACCRASRNWQFFFVNGRQVKSRLLMAALEQAYQNQKMVGKFPACVLHVEVKLSQVDVNVHPAKTVVKFLNEKQVFDLVYHAASDALDRDGAPEPLHTSPRPAAQAPKPQEFYRSMTAQEWRAQNEVKRPEPPKRDAPFIAVTSASSELGGRVSVSDFVRRTPAPPAKKPEDGHILPKMVEAAFMPPRDEAAKLEAPAAPHAEAPAAPVFAVQTMLETVPAEPEQTAIEPEPVIPWRIAGEVLDTYIVCEDAEKTVWLIDKHAAHERVNFDRFKANLEPIMSQELLTPVVAQFAAAEYTALVGQLALLREFGFACEEFGDGAILIRALPADIPAEDAAASLEDLAGRLVETHHADPESARDALLHTMACKAAIKGGWKSDERELRVLVDKVQSGEVRFCPHGRPVTVKLTKYELEKMFKRA